jgi:nicotinamide phosphoribosyltransferase
MCAGTKDDEIGTFRNLLNIYKDAPVLSVVSDTWDLWKVLTETLPTLKEEILARPGKLVIRPDSGDPVDIICGISGSRQEYTGAEIRHPSYKGVIELLWDVFGGTVNSQGFKVLDPHIGAIYGDSINDQRAGQIIKRLAAKGFASTNVVLGIGSFTYQFNTRDTFGFAMKATYVEITHDDPVNNRPTGYRTITEGREIFKDPITDDGTKKSAKGLLQVHENVTYDQEHISYELKDQVNWEDESKGSLKTIFEDGMFYNKTTLNDIRAILNNSISYL